MTDQHKSVITSLIMPKIFLRQEIKDQNILIYEESHVTPDK